MMDEAERRTERSTNRVKDVMQCCMSQSVRQSAETDGAHSVNNIRITVVIVGDNNREESVPKWEEAAHQEWRL